MSDQIYKYEIRLANQAGTEIKILTDISKLKLSRVVNGVGSLDLEIPEWDEYENIKPYSRIAVYRSIAGEPLKLVGETIWIVINRKRIRKNKKKFLVVYASDANWILESRIIAYKSGTSQAQKNGRADDFCKAIVRENLGSLVTDSARQITAINVPSDTSSAPTIAKGCSHKNVLATLQELVQASYSSGTWLGFDLVAYDFNSFEFKTYPNVRGVDRRYSSIAQPVIINADINLGDFELSENYETSVGVIYAGGRGEGSDREVITAINTTRILSNISRVEKFIDARNSDSAQLVSEANTALRNYRPKTSFVAEFIQTKNLLFGRDINFGDFVLVEVEDLILECRIDAFALELSGAGQETVKIVLKSDT